MSEKKVTFGRVFWPSLIAAFIVSVIGLLIWVIIIGSLVSTEPTTMEVADKTVLHMTLDGSIGERGKSNFDPTSFQMTNTLGLSEILNGIEEAKNDDNIKGIFIEIGNLGCGFATAKEIHDALNDFEESGKFVVAYNSGEVVSHLEYYISAAATENYGFPTTNVQFLGLGAELMFFKNALDKLGVEMQVIRGSNNDFKSAVEPFFREDMSDSSRVQIERYIEGLWQDYREDIAIDRGLTANKLNQLADNADIKDVDDAVEHKLMDASMYRDEVIDIVREKAGTAESAELELLAFSKFARKRFYQSQVLIEVDSPNIAVILAQGGISTNGDGMTSEEICKLFQEARANESIQTVVFRVNSPGGSALASDEIWREVKLTNETKKVIVSMGDVAASGGYYVATAATAIFAEPNTITGSIGVFGVIPYTGQMLEDQLGLTFDRASTNEHSIMTTNKRLTEEEFAMIQEVVDDIYFDFKSRVAEGRGMTVEQVDVIARGRVWTGRDAQEIGLVDELGGLTDAITYAADLAGITDAKVLYYPIVKEDIFGEFLEQLEEQTNVQSSPALELPEALMKQYAKLKMLESYSGIQMRLPYDLEIQ
ncbi:MAG: signal peptide peptidase SppA [Crocinitomicaceae bacterium]|nr:signal peptide peptidase SppA [Crocinitomicaceae bacterium]